MALTDQQKAENKAANLVRDRAHSARSREMRAAVEAAEQSAEVLESRKKLDDVMKACDADHEARHAAIKVIEAQIEALKLQIIDLRNTPESQVLNEQRRKAADDWYALKRSKIQLAEDAFPDLKGHAEFSAPAWKPPQEVLDAMEEARQNAQPAPAKKMRP